MLQVLGEESRPVARGELAQRAFKEFFALPPFHVDLWVFIPTRRLRHGVKGTLGMASSLPPRVA